jgi:hypothetical protein
MNLKAHIRENVGFCFACHRRCNTAAYSNRSVAHNA